MKYIGKAMHVTKVTGILFAVFLATACGGAALSGQATPAATQATTSAAATSAAATSVTATKASANNASNTELIAALTAAGVPNPANWAREVAEYRPYDVSDPNLAKLRQNLVKYNPAPGVVDKIVSALSLP